MLAYPLGERRVGLAGEQDRQGELALVQIVADRFSRGRLVDRAVEHVVGDLEGAAERAPVALQGAGERGADRASHSGTPGDERSRLPIDDPKIVLDRGVGIARPLELGDLPFGHLRDRGGERLDHRERAGERDGLERAREAEVADQHDQAVAEHHARGRPPAPHPPVVDDVVVIQGRGVDELGGAADRDAVLDRRVGRARGQHRDERSQPLAARPEQVRADLGDRAHGALEALAEPRLDGAQLVVDERDDRGDGGAGGAGFGRVHAGDIGHRRGLGHDVSKYSKRFERCKRNVGGRARSAGCAGQGSAFRSLTPT